MRRLQDVYFRKTDLALKGNMAFDKNMLVLLLAIDEKKSILDVAREVQLDTDVFKKCLVKLHKLKLIEKVEKKIEYLNGSFLNSVSSNLVNLLGPLGEMLLEEAAEQLDMELSAIPKNRMHDFLDTVAKEIPGEKQREDFQTAMRKKFEI